MRGQSAPASGLSIDELRALIMRHTSMTRPRCADVLDAFAAMVRADERELFALAQRKRCADCASPAGTACWDDGLGHGAAPHRARLAAARLAREEPTDAR